MTIMNAQRGEQMVGKSAVMDEVKQESPDVSTDDTDQDQIALIMNGDELSLLTDLEKIQKSMKVKYPSLKLFARGPWLVDKIIEKDPTLVSKSFEIVYDFSLQDKEFLKIGDDL